MTLILLMVKKAMIGLVKLKWLKLNQFNICCATVFSGSYEFILSIPLSDLKLHLHNFLLICFVRLYEHPLLYIDMRSFCVSNGTILRR